MVSRGDAPASRRQWLAATGAALAGVGALGLEAEVSVPAQAATGGAPELSSAQVKLLNHLLDLEYKTIAGYEAGIPLLDPASAMTAQQFLRQELAHSGELAGLVKQAGGKPVKPRLGYDLGHPNNAAQTLALLHALEAEQVAAYLEVIPRLPAGSVRASLASVVANDAQHLAILRERRQQPPDPAAFASARE